MYLKPANWETTPSNSSCAEKKGPEAGEAGVTSRGSRQGSGQGTVSGASSRLVGGPGCKQSAAQAQAGGQAGCWLSPALPRQACRTQLPAAGTVPSHPSLFSPSIVIHTPPAPAPHARTQSHLHRAERGRRVRVARHHGRRQLAQRGGIAGRGPARGAPAGRQLLVHGTGKHVAQQLRQHLVPVVVGVGAAPGGCVGVWVGQVGVQLDAGMLLVGP